MCMWGVGGRMRVCVCVCCFCMCACTNVFMYSNLCIRVPVCFRLSLSSYVFSDILTSMCIRVYKIA